LLHNAPAGLTNPAGVRICQSEPSQFGLKLTPTPELIFLMPEKHPNKRQVTVNTFKTVCAAVIIPASVFFAASMLKAAPLKSVASVDRSLYPDPIITREEFDRASRIENLMFLKVLYELQGQRDNYRTLLGVKSSNQQSVAKWTDKTIDIILQNILEAAKSCKNENDIGCAPKEISRNTLYEYAVQVLNELPSRYQLWSKAAMEFYRAYGVEQLRLAALFPNITSEILTFSDREITGTEFKDLEFLLTFDDGPSAAGGVTDKLKIQLNEADIHGVFFVLRDAIHNRVDKTSVREIQELYQNQCVGIHGSVHKPHPKMPDWKGSIDSSLTLIQALIQENFNQMFFRPPYGQRSEEMLAYLTERKVPVMLWNIDSQDWNSKIGKERVADRVLTLMLLWRRGIILFHDIHDKVLAVLPDLVNKTKSVGIHWKDCRILK